MGPIEIVTALVFLAIMAMVFKKPLLFRGQTNGNEDVAGSYFCEGCSTRRTASTRGKACPVCNPKGPTFRYPQVKCPGCGVMRSPRDLYNPCPTCARGKIQTSQQEKIQPTLVPKAPTNISAKESDQSPIPDEVLNNLNPWDPMSYRNIWNIKEGLEYCQGTDWVDIFEAIGKVGKEINSDPYYLQTLNAGLGLKCESIHFEITKTHRIDYMAPEVGGDSFPAFGISKNALTHLGILGPQEVRKQGSLRWSLGALIGSQPDFFLPVIIVATRKDGVDKIAVVVLLDVCMFPEVAEIFARLFNMRISGSPEIPGLEDGLVCISRLGLIVHGFEGGLDIRFLEHMVPWSYWATIATGVFLRMVEINNLPKDRDVRLFCPRMSDPAFSIFSSEVASHSGMADCWY